MWCSHRTTTSTTSLRLSTRHIIIFLIWYLAPSQSKPMEPQQFNSVQYFNETSNQNLIPPPSDIELDVVRIGKNYNYKAFDNMRLNQQLYLQNDNVFENLLTDQQIERMLEQADSDYTQKDPALSQYINHHQKLDNMAYELKHRVKDYKNQKPITAYRQTLLKQLTFIGQKVQTFIDRNQQRELYKELNQDNIDLQMKEYQKLYDQSYQQIKKIWGKIYLSSSSDKQYLSQLADEAAKQQSIEEIF